jgi:hypothetical protein
MQTYGVKCDAEVLDMLDTAARQLEVCVYTFRSFSRSSTEEPRELSN